MTTTPCPDTARPTIVPRGAAVARRVEASSPDTWRRTAGWAADLAVVSGLDASRRDAFHLAVHEALCNAVEHGHLGDHRLPVAIRVVSTRTRLRCTVGDRARGGRWGEPGVPAGHGGTLMASGADAVRVHAGSRGTRVRLEVRLAPATGARHAER